MSDEEVMLLREFFNGLKIKISYRPDYECPNELFDIWEMVDEHEGGVTVQHPYAGYGHHKWWKSCNDTPATLAKCLAEVGEKNPSARAYEILQKDLLHYTCGDMYTVNVFVSIDDMVLAHDGCGFDWSSYMDDKSCEDFAWEIVRECFDFCGLIRTARKNAAAKIDILSRVA